MQPVKNKKLTYLLICAVAVVWGIVVYKFVFNDTGDDYALKSFPVKKVDEPYDQYAAKPDTFKLALNYRDPFGEHGQAVVVQELPVSAGQPTNFIPTPMPPPPIDWSFIRYSGYVTSPATKKLVSIMVVNGQERMVAEGEVFGGVKLLKNKKDSILVSWQGKQKYIKQ